MNSHLGKTGYTSIVHLVYTICTLSVLFVCMMKWNKYSESASALGDSGLKTYNELEAMGFAWEYPAEWEFLDETNSSTHQQVEHTKPTVHYVQAKEVVPFDREQISNDVAEMAERIKSFRTRQEKRKRSPLLRIYELRQNSDHTFQNSDSWVYSEIAPQTGKHLDVEIPQVEQDAQPTEVMRQETGKPTIQNTEANEILETFNQMERKEETQELTGKTSNQPTVESASIDVLNPPSIPEETSVPTETSVPEETYKESTPVVSVNSGISNPISEKSTQPVHTSNKLSIHNSMNLSQTVEEEEYNHEDGMKILRYFNHLAKERLNHYDQLIQDYECVLYKMDPTNSKSEGYDVMKLKVREKPYSIYCYTEFPDRVNGREWLYWEGRYNGMMVVNSGPNLLSRTIPVDPNANGVKSCATRSVLQLGFRRLLEELVEISSQEQYFQNAVIRYYAEAKVGNRKCCALEVVFPQATEGVDFYKIQIFVDREYILPTKLMIYDAPKNGAEPEVREVYTYVIQRLNPGLKNMDFCHLNPQYHFKHYIPHIPDEEIQLMESLAGE